MNGASGRMWRGALVALAIGALSAAPVAADVPSEPEESEVIGSEFSAPAPAMLVLEPQCTRDGLRRFAVEHLAGPATQFAVSVAGTPDGQNVAIAVGETLQFWVEAAEADPVQITWSDGTASATPVDDPCVPAGNVYGAPGPAPGPSAMLTPSPDPTPADRPRPTPGRGDADAQVATGSSGDAGSRVSEPGTGRAPAAPEDSATDDTQAAAPRPRPSGGAIVCPDGWDPVDTDSDRRIETSYRCEVVIETASEARPAGSGFTVAALALTIALLLASISVGAVGRHRG